MKNIDEMFITRYGWMHKMKKIYGLTNTQIDIYGLDTPQSHGRLFISTAQIGEVVGCLKYAVIDGLKKLMKVGIVERENTKYFGRWVYRPRHPEIVKQSCLDYDEEITPNIPQNTTADSSVRDTPPNSERHTALIKRNNVRKATGTAPQSVAESYPMREDSHEEERSKARTVSPPDFTPPPPYSPSSCSVNYNLVAPWG